jgi:hypothetical protein
MPFVAQMNGALEKLPFHACCCPEDSQMDAAVCATHTPEVVLYETHTLIHTHTHSHTQTYTHTHRFANKLVLTHYGFKFVFLLTWIHTVGLVSLLPPCVCVFVCVCVCVCVCSQPYACA